MGPNAFPQALVVALLAVDAVAYATANYEIYGQHLKIKHKRAPCYLSHCVLCKYDQYML